MIFIKTHFIKPLKVFFYTFFQFFILKYHYAPLYSTNMFNSIFGNILLNSRIIFEQL